ncbi:hypothetical protein [Rugosibacter aromaticivorans]|uniref:hypothetical protein n=1 Tax=Rugosibacter aromaticivorans TaxID=1565605 RepID=UPI001226B720|nr:hypothetical protein [Rugosibacter aromaticivorans]TBR14778.1 MAG: hypothetical protein EPO43_06475 [Rugosibacter sp.]
MMPRWKTTGAFFCVARGKIAARAFTAKAKSSTALKYAPPMAGHPGTTDPCCTSLCAPSPTLAVRLAGTTAAPTDRHLAQSTTPPPIMPVPMRWGVHPWCTEPTLPATGCVPAKHLCQGPEP